MKIAVLVRNFNRNAGGAERYCVELSERLSENNEVHIYSQTFDEKLPTIEFHKISKYFDKPRFLNQLLFSYLTKKATSGKFDIVHSHEMVSDADRILNNFIPKEVAEEGFNKGRKVINTDTWQYGFFYGEGAKLMSLAVVLIFFLGVDKKVWK